MSDELVKATGLQIVTAPNYEEWFVPTLFLAGGITGCEYWRKDALAHLGTFPHVVDTLTILDPQRPSFDINDASEGPRQVEWEWYHLARADAVFFWFCPETLNPIVLYELGAMSKTDKPLFVGVHKDYQRRLDVEYQLRFARPKVEVRTDLESVVRDVAVWLKQEWGDPST